MKNFDRPYFAASLTDFWRRWHISLSTWFRDYVYIPLGGNRTSKARWMFNIFITFVISGLWHGANRTFVIWGALHGAYLVIETVLGSIFKRPEGKDWPAWLTPLRILLTFHVVCLGWIYFRADRVKDANYIVKNLFSKWDPSWTIAGLDATHAQWALALAAFLFVVEWAQSKGPLEPRLARLPMPVRWAGYTVLMLAIFNLGVAKAIPFIYFQF
jgi:D-alanyl-lipoteichoic acid acyltransferase DltB (MBOAT superfamily)